MHEGYWGRLFSANSKAILSQLLLGAQKSAVTPSDPGSGSSGGERGDTLH